MSIQFPDTPVAGDQPTTLSNGVSYIWDGEKWSSYGNSGGGGSSNIDSGPNPPFIPQPGDLWFNTVNGVLYVYYDDGNSKQWVQTVPGGGGDGEGGIPEAPLDGKQYGREDGGWTETDDIPALPPLPGS